MNNINLLDSLPDSLPLNQSDSEYSSNILLAPSSKYELREYQRDLIDKVEKSWLQGKKRIMLQLATGGGKTIVFSDIIKNYLSRDLKVLVIAHKKELIQQAYSKIKEIANIEPGYIKSGLPANELAPVQVASIQTLSRRNKPPADLIVIDEAHHSCAKSYSDLFKIYDRANILGVTATPIRIDGQGFHLLYDDLIKGPNTDWLIEMGYLSPFKLFAAKIKLDVKEGKNSKNEYSQSALSKAIRENAIVNENAIDTWFKYAENKQTVVFAVSIEHSLKLRDMYRAKGILAEHLDGSTKDAERERIIADFRDKKITVLTNCEIISEGFDVPAIECVQCIRPTKSLGLWLQMLGRSLRPAQNKDCAIVLDHTFNYKQLGLPDKNHDWSLYPISLEKDKHTLECAECGHIFRPLSHESTRVIRVGINSKGKFRKYYRAICPVCQEVVEFDLGFGGEPNVRETTAMTNLEMVEVENGVYEWFLDVIERLLQICQERGYQKGWIQHQILDGDKRRHFTPDLIPINLKALRLKEWEFLAKILGYKKGWAWHRHSEAQNIIKLQSQDIS